MSDVKRSVDIVLNVTGNALEGLRSLSNKLKELSAPLDSISKNIDNTTKKVSKLVTSFKELSKNVPDLSKLAGDLKKISSINVSKEASSNLSSVVSSYDTLAKKINAITVALNNYSRNAVRSNKSVNSSFLELDNTLVRTSRSAKTLLSRFEEYLQYRAIADLVFAIKGAFEGALSSIKNYDQALADLRAITSASAAETAAMGVTILKVASTTKFSAEEIAAGMRTLGQAGFSASESIKSIQSISDLATGTLTSMQASVDLVTSAIRTFGSDTLDATHASDVFANAVNKSKLTVDKIAVAFSYVAPIAKSAGISFEDMSAAMGVLANAGFRASKISTGLRRVIAELVKPTDKLVRAANAAGITLDQLNPKGKNLQSVLEALKLVITDTETAFDIFGKRGAATALVLAENADNFSNMRSVIGESGTAAAMAATQMEGLGVMVKNMTDKLGVLAVALGNAGITTALKLMVGTIRDVTDAIIEFVNSPLGNLTVTLGVISVAFLTLNTAVLGLTAVFSKVIASTVAMNAAFAATAAETEALTSTIFGLDAALATNPIVLFVTAMTGLYVVLQGMSKSSEQLVSSFDRVRNSINKSISKTDDYAAAISKLQTSSKGTLDSEEKRKELISDMISDYPEYIQLIVKNKDSYSGLYTVLKKIKELEYDKYLEKTKNGLSDLAMAAAKYYTEMRGIAFWYTEKQRTKVTQRNMELQTKQVSVIKKLADAYIELNKAGKVSDFSEFWNTIQDNVPHHMYKTVQRLRTEVESMISSLSKVESMGKGGSLGLFSSIKNEFDSTSSEFVGFFDNLSNIIDNVSGPLKDKLNGIFTPDETARLKNIQLQKKSLLEQRMLLEEELKQYKDNNKLKTEEDIKYYKELLSRKDILNAKLAELNKQLTDDYVYHTALRLEKENSAYKEELSTLKKKFDAGLILSADYYAKLAVLNNKYKGKLQDAAGSLFDPKRMFKESQDTIIQIENSYKKLYATLDAQVANDQISFKEAQRDKTFYAAEQASEVAKVWKEAYAKLQSVGAADTEYGRKIFKNMQDSAARAAEESSKQVVLTKKQEVDAVIKLQRNVYKRLEIEEKKYHSYIDTLVAKGVKTKEQAELDKLTATIKRYSAEYLEAKKVAARMKSLGDDKAVQDSNNKVLEAQQKLEKAKNDLVISNAIQRSKLLEQIHVNSLSSIKALEEKAYADLATLRADGVISHEQAEKEKVRITISALRAMYAENVAYRNKVNKGTDEYAKRDKEVKAIEEKILKLRTSYLEKYVNESEQAEKKIEEIDATRITATQEQHDKLESLEQEYASKIEAIHIDLNNKLASIDKEREDNTRSVYNDKVQLEADAQDRIRAIRQRGMSDEQIDAQNRIVSYTKYKEGIRLVAEAKKKADLDMLKRGQELLKQSSSIGSSLKDEDAAIRAIARSTKALKEARDIQGYIKDLELQKKKEEEIAKARSKEDVLVKQYEKAVSSEKERHALVIKNLDKELAKYKEQLKIAKELKDIAANATVPSSTEQSGILEPTQRDYFKPVVDQSDDAVQAIRKIGDTWTNVSSGIASDSNTVGNSLKSSAESAASGYEEFIKVTTESGKTVITTAKSMSSGFSAFGKVVKTEALGSVKELRTSIDSISSSKVDLTVDSNADAAIQEVQRLKNEFDSLGTIEGNTKFFSSDDLSRIKEIGNELSSIFDNFSTVSAKQELQDMVTVFNAMVDSGKVSSRKLGEELNKVVDKAHELDNVQVNIDIVDGKSVLSLVDNVGNEIQNLRSDIQSNPLKLGLDNREVIKALDEIPGLLDRVRENASEPTELNIDTSKAENSLESTKEKVDDLKDSATTQDTEIEVTADTSDVQDKVNALPSELPSDIPITIVAEGVDEIKGAVEELGSSEVDIPANLRLNGKDPDSVISDIDASLKAICGEQCEFVIVVDKDDFDSLLNDIASIEDLSIEVTVSVRGVDEVKALVLLLSELKSKSIEVDVDVNGDEDVQSLKQLVDSFKNKAFTITATVIGLDKITRLKNTIDSLKNKTVTVTTIYKKVTKKAAGGLVEQFADGGHVFRRPVTPFINRGSGTKDDVPALLMKGEFVQKVSAVRKYGRKFMELVNQGLYPVELARKAVQGYFNGGIVDTVSKLPVIQKFAKGGAVLSNNISSLKNRLFELLNGHDKGMSVGTVIVNNILQNKVDSITSDLGKSSIESLGRAFSNTVNSFALGGNVSDDLVKEKSSIEQQYNSKIQQARESGNVQIAELLKQERDSIKQIADELSKKLVELKVEYDSSLSELNREHEERLSELKSSYEDDKKETTDEYNREVYDDTVEYNRRKQDHTIKLEEIDSKYREEVQKVLEDPNLSPEQIKADLDKKLSEINQIYSKLWNYANKFDYREWDKERRVYTSFNTSYYRGRDNRRRVAPDINYVTPDYVLSKLQSVSSNTGWGYGNYSAGTAKKYESEVLELKSSLESIQAELATYGIKSIDMFRKGYVNIDKLVSEYRDTKVSNALRPIKEEYESDKRKEQLEWGRFVADYTVDTSRRDEDFNKEIADIENTYKTNVDEENASYTEQKASIEQQYKDDVATAKEDAAQRTAEVKEQTALDIEEVRRSVNDDIKQFSSELSSKLNEIGSSSTSVDTSTLAQVDSDTVQRTSGILSVEELLKKLIGTRLRFNTGGFVPFLRGALPNKDSILAALTPGEYVINAEAVRAFGTNFLDSINNIQIPSAFNVGGYVSNASDTVRTSVSKYALELSINGVKQEPLYGSKTGIESIIDSLAIAKMRA